MKQILDDIKKRVERLETALVGLLIIVSTITIGILIIMLELK